MPLDSDYSSDDEPSKLVPPPPPVGSTLLDIKSLMASSLNKAPKAPLQAKNAIARQPPTNSNKSTTSTRPVKKVKTEPSTPSEPPKSALDITDERVRSHFERIFADVDENVSIEVSPHPLHRTYTITKQQSKDYKELGLELKEGRFTSTEDRVLLGAAKAYVESIGKSIYDIPSIADGLHGSRARNEMSQHISSPFPNRSRLRIMRHLGALTHPGNFVGKWTVEDEIKLYHLVQQYGRDWRLIGDHLGRFRESCRYKWRDLEQDPKKLESILKSEPVPYVRQQKHVMNDEERKRVACTIVETFLDIKSKTPLSKEYSPNYSRRIPVQTIKECAFASQIPWSAISFRYNNIPGVPRTLSSRFIRLFWRKFMRRRIAYWIETRKKSKKDTVKFKKFFKKTLPYHKMKFTLDLGKIMMDRVLQLFPNTLAIKDICFDQVKSGTDLRFFDERSLRSFLVRMLTRVEQSAPLIEQLRTLRKQLDEMEEESESESEGDEKVVKKAPRNESKSTPTPKKRKVFLSSEFVETDDDMSDDGANDLFDRLLAE